MRAIILGTLALILLTVPMANAATTVVYFNNFDGTETFSLGATGGLSGVTTKASSVGNYGSTAPFSSYFSGDFLINNTGGAL